MGGYEEDRYKEVRYWRVIRLFDALYYLKGMKG